MKEEKTNISEIDFSTFLISLATSAFIHLGLVQDNEGKKSDINLPLARQSIDILSVLKEKTKGNLSEDETKLLDSLLFDLRMKYVDFTKNQAQKE